jgi:hypothetical protein
LFKHPFVSSLAATAFTVAGPATAAPIANWVVFNDGTSPISGADTDSPVVGDGVTDSSAESTLGSYFGAAGSPQSVALEEGDTLTVSLDFILTGAGTTSGNNFRFGVFDDNGQMAGGSPSGWSGYIHWINNHLNLAGSGQFPSNGGRTDLEAESIDPSGTFQGNSVLPYTWTMSITRDSATTIDITSTFVGGDGELSNTFVAEDEVTTIFEYNSIGILFGGSSQVTQVEFFDASYEVSGDAIPGDTDGDGDVDDADLGAAFSNYTGPLAAGEGTKTAEQGDVDGDGDIDDADLGAAFAAYTGPLSSAAVPEPTSLALLGLGGLLVARRRRA